ncbi:histidine kinase [Pseudomonas sp. RP23018S]|uniref:histidine kinase n=1 Tax=Pseudomonas sp. RP23018S TaxID=3096037 RepID=UPI002ACA59C2|nr:histidine kinase [Pseudomonas sp. RP23018S]MDZ5603508.1 histidine kinase [Pseudomonas sp. RP23018S]
MNRLTVLIHQQHPFHQITLHQACNAQGIFRVRLVNDLLTAPLSLQAPSPADLLILDQAMPARSGKVLLERLRLAPATPALLFVGKPQAKRPDFARLARERGLWVLDELTWPLSAPALSQALRRLNGITRPLAQQPA